MPTSHVKADVLYIQDALCGWCYGFSPIIDQIRKYRDGAIRIIPVHGGLWPGAKARVMDESLVAHLNTGMPKVTDATGQIFGSSFRENIINNPLFIYDTEPAARAALVVRDCAPQYELDFIKDIQRAFFIHGQDPALTETFTSIVRPYGIEPDKFLTLYHDSHTAKKTQLEFAQCAAWKITLFPTLLHLINGKLRIISIGSCTMEHFIKNIDPAIQSNT